MEVSTPLRSPELPLDLTRLYHPVGYPVQVVTNCQSVLEAAEESWSAFPELFSTNPVQLRIAVHPDVTPAPDSAPSYRFDDGWFTIASADANHAVCDLLQGCGTATLGEATVRHRSWFRYYFLDAMGYALVDAKTFTPVHAGCVSWNGQGVLLCGDSGAGKSSLSYACARSGWTYVSDDASHLIRGQLTVVGFPHELRLREPARQLFPELRDRRATPRATGKMSIEIRTAELPGMRTAPQAEVRHVVFLSRRAGPAGLQPYSKEEAFGRMAAVLAFAKGDLLDAHLVALRKLLSIEVWELSYHDLGTAVDRLLSLVPRD